MAKKEAAEVLARIRDRPSMLKRFVDGAEREPFYRPLAHRVEPSHIRLASTEIPTHPWRLPVKKIHSIAVPTALSALLLLACQEPPTSPVEAPVSYELGIRASAASNGNPSATGGGTTVELGEKSTFTFNAIEHKNGAVNGHLVYHIRGVDVSIHMDIDCLNIIGNEATLSGTVTKVSADAPAFIFEGQKGVFKVVDNGEGGDAPPDLISDVFLFTGATCNNPFPAPYLPIDGNIQVSG